MTTMSDPWRAKYLEIADRRIELGLTWAELYRRADVSEATLRHMRVSGQPIMTALKRRSLCRALGWPADCLEHMPLGPTAPPTPSDPAPVTREDFDNLVAEVLQLRERIREWTEPGTHPVDIPPLDPTAEDPSPPSQQRPSRSARQPPRR